MLNEIQPYHFFPEYVHKKAEKEEAFICLFDAEQILLCREEEDKWRLPRLKDMLPVFTSDYIAKHSYYTGCIALPGKEEHKEEFFVLLDKDMQLRCLKGADEENILQDTKGRPTCLYFKPLRFLRFFEPKKHAFAASTASHVQRWMRSRFFCGHCGSKNRHSETERAMVCPLCQLREYPKISPAVIVAVIDKERIVLTKDKHGAYPNYALVAGFVEIGESPIDTVIREVKEEVGLRVKNIREYKSQPWGFSDTLMLAYTAELDGDDTIVYQESELKGAYWFHRKDVPVLERHISVGQEMIEMFKLGKL